MSAVLQSPHRVCVAGASGRMGQMLVDAVRGSGDCTLTGALDVATSTAIGLDAGAFSGRSTGVVITTDLAAGLAGSQVLIDFTRPEGTMAHLKACVAHKVNLVIGTTGFSDEQKAEITALERRIVRRFSTVLDQVNPGLNTKERPLLMPVTMSLFGMMTSLFFWRSIGTSGVTGCGDGRSILIAWVATGMVMMNMMRRTSMTSINGVVFISIIGWPSSLPPLIAMMFVP